MIGVMDSGIGGITTLSRLMDVCGGDYLYVSDKMTYGDKSEEFILDRTMKACALLKRRGAKIIVLACNTATNVAIASLRRLDNSTYYIGTEPAVMPALRECQTVTVALTPSAARTQKFRTLIGDFSDRVELVTPPSLASEIEGTYMDKCALMHLAEGLLRSVNGDGLVLGCTHYVFLKRFISELRPSLKIYDGNDGVAKRLLLKAGKEEISSVEFLKLG